jgi:DnaK suppressor protein
MPAKKAATPKKAAAKKAVKKAAVKKAVAKKPAAKKAAVKKAPAKKATVKKASSQKAALKKAPAANKKSVTTSKKPTVKSTSKKTNPAKMIRTTDLEGVGHVDPYIEKKGEEYMSSPMREHFRKILMHWKTELMEEVDRTVHHMQDEAANFPDPNDRASQESDFTMELRTRDRERKLLKKINESLDLLDEGEYGYCETCGIEIGLRRLEARPTATLCIDCKTLDEIREKQRG